MLTFDVMADSNYPFPSPDWITSNASWAAKQLAVYYANRTGTQSLLPPHSHIPNTTPHI